MNRRLETVSNKPLAAAEKSDRQNIKITNFDAEQFRASFTLRCAALLLDYTILIAAPVIALMMTRASGVRGAKLFDNSTYHFGWLIALLLLITNFVILPTVSGRTIGKAIMGLQVVQKDGRNLTIGSAMIRHLIGYPLTILTFGLGFLFAIFNSKGRALQDYLAGTIVVQGRKFVVKPSKAKPENQ